MKKTALICLLMICLIGVGVFAAPRPTLCVTMSVVTVTAYHPGVYGGHGARGITASGMHVKEGIVAVSRDIEHVLNLGFGDRVLLHGLGVFEFQDRMASHVRQKVDVFMKTKQKAIRFGVRRSIVLVKLV
jgi:3D (Asp-Asp-Asp) domain-containing protein